MTTARDVIAGRAAWAVDHDDTDGWCWRLPKRSVYCVVTSPPYFGLRNYNLPPTDWPEVEYTPVAGLPPVRVPMMTCCLGLERTPEEYTAHLIDVFRGLRRALHPSGVVWLNLGDTYATSAGGNAAGRSKSSGLQGAKREVVPRSNGVPDQLKSKDLIGVPWRVAFALQADGWYLRQWCPWVKRNPMPESADDRPSTACETVFLFSKSDRYFFDMEAVKRTAADSSRDRAYLGKRPLSERQEKIQDIGIHGPTDTLRVYDRDERNFRSADLWFDSVGMLIESGELLGIDQPTTPYKDAHFATFPPRLVLPMILAGTSDRGVCPACGEPWVRVVEKDRQPTRPGTDTKVFGGPNGRINRSRDPNHPTELDGKKVGNRDPERHVTRTRTVGWEPGCGCNAGEPEPAVVADPFAGSGTVLAVAHKRNRRAVGCELNPDYVRMAEKRIGRVISGLI